ncbi:uncharacterized protein METZ01_LOCUS57645 [marine metagenome]|uniref:Uncharacterized protein n=1 Tax=marine metagenome TaxID=408172 RepID=A0A381SN64_9ZZZZ
MKLSQVKKLNLGNANHYYDYIVIDIKKELT